ncbi:hypothetical protein FYJ51_01730 [Erysipelotrichaceae bacterium Oil+RF-744-GAM-WT-6]|uniref:Uncharacterized protein n=1 Tax=Stecheria intestinalis TaxID=2606630 RepID=A0A7X2NQM0_9FIRM|nr:hypothetical protein [Stecheria intestinalis]MSS57630.1 hypothetical protein [Stecheria intestinalis]
MTIDELEELRYLNSEIRAVQQEIEGMYNTYRSPAFEKIGSSPQLAGDPTSEAVQKIMALQQKYNRMLNDMADRRDRVNAWLVSLDTGEIKSIIRWHYLNGKSWKQTSGLVYGANSYYNARKALMRWFGKEK